MDCVYNPSIIGEKLLFGGDNMKIRKDTDTDKTPAVVLYSIIFNEAEVDNVIKELNTIKEELK